MASSLSQQSKQEGSILIHMVIRIKAPGDMFEEPRKGLGDVFAEPLVLQQCLKDYKKTPA